MKVNSMCFLLILMGFFLNLSAQYELKRYEFPEWGFSANFYKNAKLVVYDTGSRGELRRYILQSDKKEDNFIARMDIYPNTSCLSTQEFYNIGQDRVKALGENKAQFRILSELGQALPFNWMKYTAMATINDRNAESVSRNLHLYSDGRVLVVLDVIYKSAIHPKVNPDPIFNAETGFQSIDYPLILKEFGIKTSIHGNVHINYKKEQNTYVMMLCGKFKEIYPHLVWSYIYKEPSEVAKQIDMQLSKNEKIKSHKHIGLESKDKLSKLTDVQKLTYHTVEDIENKKIDVHSIEYLFSFNKKHYRLILNVPLVENEIKTYLGSTKFQVSDAAIFEQQLLEMLSNLKTL